MKKRLTSLLLVMVLTASLAGCGKQNANDNIQTAPSNNILTSENAYPDFGIHFQADEILQQASADGRLHVSAGGLSYPQQAEDGSLIPPSTLDYGYIHFAAVTKNGQANLPNDDPDACQKWLEEETVPLCRISMFSSAALEKQGPEVLTGMENNREVGETGGFRFYFSTPQYDESLPKEAARLMDQLEASLKAMEESIRVAQPTEFQVDEELSSEDMFGTNRLDIDSIGQFQALDLDGNEVTSEIFQDYDLTLINIWATWCSPCIAELPALGELAKELKDQGVQIIGIVADVVDPATGEIDQEALELAKWIRERTGIEYTILLPDDVLLEGLMSGMTGYPETSFVDQDGRFVTEPMLGAHSKEEWLEIIREVQGKA